MKKVTLLVVSSLLLFLVSTAQRNSDNPYDEVEDYSEGLARVKLDGKYGFINLAKKEVIEIKYAEARDFSYGLAAVSVDGKKWGYINTSGKKVVDFKLDEAHAFDEEYACAQKDKKWGMLDKYGNIAIPFKYDKSFYLNNGYARVQENGHYGIINKNGKVLVPFIYADLGYFYESDEKYITAKKDGKWGYISYDKGKTIIPFEYESAGGYNEGLFSAKRNGKWGYVDKENKVVIPFMYYNARLFIGGEAKVFTSEGGLFDDGDFIFINKNNEKLGPGQWGFLFSKGGFNGKQYWSSTKTFPSDDIKKKWDEDYYISSLRYGFDGNYFLVMTKNSSLKAERYVRRDSFDELNEEVGKMWAGSKPTHPQHRISYLSYLNGEWFMVATKSSYSNNNQRLFRIKPTSYLYENYAPFPISSIENNWKEGRYVDAIALNPKTKEYVYVASNASYYTDQKYQSYYYNLEQKDINAWEKKGYTPTQIIKHDGTYHVIYTKFSRYSNTTDATLNISDNLPTRDIKGYWDKGFTITDIFKFERQ